MTAGAALVTIIGSLACVVATVGGGRKAATITYGIYLAILALLAAFTDIFSK